jgi:hypothetical protein
MQTPLPGAGIKPTIPVFERGKTFHALNNVATVIDGILNYAVIFSRIDTTIIQLSWHYENRYDIFKTTALAIRCYNESPSTSRTIVLSIP